MVSISLLSLDQLDLVSRASLSTFSKDFYSVTMAFSASFSASFVAYAVLSLPYIYPIVSLKRSFFVSSLAP